MRILFLGSQPTGTKPLSLPEELRKISMAMGVAIAPIWHPTFSDLAGQISKWRPHIVQFSGHGVRGGKPVFETELFRPEIVPPEAVSLLCSMDEVRRRVRGVVLNACFSKGLAEQLIRSFDFVIGTPDVISDQAAIRFPSALYGALGRGTHLRDAFTAAEADFAVKQTENRPELLTAAGVDPRGYYLRAEVPARASLYIHYHPSDRELLNELRVHLTPLNSQVEIWDQSQIRPGEPISEVTTRRLEQAQMILLLLGPAALADERWLLIKDRACARQQARTARILPLCLRACLFQKERFAGVERLNGDPIGGMNRGQRDTAWLELVQRIAGEAVEIKRRLDEDRVIEAELDQSLAATLTSAGTMPVPGATGASPPPSPTVAVPPVRVPTKSSLRKS